MPLSLGDMGGLAIAFIVVAVTISIGASILVGVQATQTANSASYNITTKGITGTSSLGDWLPTIAIVVGAAVILGIVMYLRQ
jgi:hypothetical protein